MKAILSIRPEYVDRILSGEKKYEFRKRIFKREDVDTIVIYSTSPCCRVVAQASIAEIIQDSPERIWKKTKKNGGIAKEKFMTYFDGKEVAYAIRISAVRRLTKPCSLDEYAPQVKAAPQSFVYVR